MLISRSDRSKKAIWFWTIDRWLFSSFLVLITLGAFFIMASGPKIANNLGLDTHFFTVRHIFFLIIGFILVLFISQINEKLLKIISIIGLILCLFFDGASVNKWNICKRRSEMGLYFWTKFSTKRIFKTFLYNS